MRCLDSKHLVLGVLAILFPGYLWVKGDSDPFEYLWVDVFLVAAGLFVPWLANRPLVVGPPRPDPANPDGFWTCRKCGTDNGNITPVCWKLQPAKEVAR